MDWWLSLPAPPAPPTGFCGIWSHCITLKLCEMVLLCGGVEPASRVETSFAAASHDSSSMPFIEFDATNLLLDNLLSPITGPSDDFNLRCNALEKQLEEQVVSIRSSLQQLTAQKKQLDEHSESLENILQELTEQKKNTEAKFLIQQDTLSGAIKEFGVVMEKIGAENRETIGNVTPIIMQASSAMITESMASLNKRIMCLENMITVQADCDVLSEMIPANLDGHSYARTGDITAGDSTPIAKETLAKTISLPTNLAENDEECAITESSCLSGDTTYLAGGPTDYIIYHKDMALKDVPFAEAVAPASGSSVDPFKGDVSDDDSYYCSDRMPSDDESDAMHCMKPNFSGACRFGSSTSIDMDDNSRPLIAHPWVRTLCAGLHDSNVSHSSHDSCDEQTCH